jgi:hypothetical protein
MRRQTKRLQKIAAISAMQKFTNFIAKSPYAVAQKGIFGQPF